MACVAHVAEIDNIIQPEAKIWNRLVVFFQKVSCQVICEEHSPNRFTALVIIKYFTRLHGSIHSFIFKVFHSFMVGAQSILLLVENLPFMQPTIF